MSVGNAQFNVLKLWQIIAFYFYLSDIFIKNCYRFPEQVRLEKTS